MEARREAEAPSAAPLEGPKGLIRESDSGVESWLPIHGSAVLVGRRADCDLLLSEPRVRALHCLLIPQADGLLVRSLHGDGVWVNGSRVATAWLRDGDRLEIGSAEFRIRWPAETPSVDSAGEAMRIQVAAVAAQQVALFDRELRLRDEEAALNAQREQIASHLEDRRRQLLELQDQITAAREQLRRERAEHEDRAAEQGRQLELARDETARLSARSRAQRRRLAQLHHRLHERHRRERQMLGDERRQVDADRAAWQTERARIVGELELDKRRLRAGFERLDAERTKFVARQAADRADLQQRQRDLARRDKAVRAAEKHLSAERDRLAKEFQDRRHEIERLETRIGHARQRLMEAQAEPAAAPAGPVSPPVVPATSTDSSRIRALAEIALDLADQRLWLGEQTARLLAARECWIAERDAAAAELQSITEALREREMELQNRAAALSQAEHRSQADAEALVQLRLRLEADHTQRLAELEAERRELADRSAALTIHEQAMARRETELNAVLRQWGRRRRETLRRLTEAIDACRVERDEWAAARDSWLREWRRTLAERRDLAARALALEQTQAQWLETREDAAVAARRIERLQRRWVVQFAADVRELERMSESLEADSGRLDERAEATARDRLALIEQSAAIDERAAELDAERLRLAADRERLAADAEAAHVTRDAAQSQLHILRNEVEGLARLFIEPPTRPLDRAA